MFYSIVIANTNINIKNINTKFNLIYINEYLMTVVIMFMNRLDIV